MKITTYRLDRGSVVLVAGTEQYDDEHGLNRYLIGVLDSLGVEYAFIPPGVELTIMSGPAYPVEIAAVAAADARRSG